MKKATIGKVAVYLGLFVIGICIGMLVKGFKGQGKITSTDTGYEIACVERFNKVNDQNYTLDKDCKVIVYDTYDRENQVTNEPYTVAKAIIYDMDGDRIGDIETRNN